MYKRQDMERFLIRGLDPILPGFGGPSTLCRGATLAACWLHEPQPISNRSVGLGVPHLPGRYRPGGSLFSSPGCWCCRYMEGFLTRGWELILPGCSGTSALSRGVTLAACWLHEPQPINNHPVGLGFHTLRSGIDPEDLRFRPRVVRVVEIWKDF